MSRYPYSTDSKQSIARREQLRRFLIKNPDLHEYNIDSVAKFNFARISSFRVKAGKFHFTFDLNNFTVKNNTTGELGGFNEEFLEKFSIFLRHTKNSGREVNFQHSLKQKDLSQETALSKKRHGWKGKINEFFSRNGFSQEEIKEKLVEGRMNGVNIDYGKGRKFRLFLDNSNDSLTFSDPEGNRTMFSYKDENSVSRLEQYLKFANEFFNPKEDSLKYSPQRNIRQNFSNSSKIKESEEPDLVKNNNFSSVNSQFSPSNYPTNNVARTLSATQLSSRTEKVR